MFILGIFLGLHTLVLSSRDLESPWVPVHMTVVGLAGSCAFGAAGASGPGRRADLGLWAGPAAFSVLLTVLYHAIGLPWGGMIAGWVLLAGWSTWSVVRGGSR